MPVIAPIAISAFQALQGSAQAINNTVKSQLDNKKLERLFKQRKAFQTPSEVFDILNAAQFQAQGGYNSKTLDYLTSQADLGLATSIGTALRLGADPNVISGLDDQYLQDIMKIGSNDAMLQLQNFDKFMNAKQLVAANKEAEWASKDNLIKDQMQAISGQVEADTKNINSGINLANQAAANFASSQLYGSQSVSPGAAARGYSTTLPAGNYPTTNDLSFLNDFNASSIH